MGGLLENRPAPRRRAAWLIAAAALALWPRPGPARAEPPVYETVVRGETVEEGPPLDDPAGFSTVLRLREPPPGAELGDLLERAPGLRIREAGPAGRQTLSLRGADSHQLAVFLDGVRLTPAAGGVVDLALIDPGHLEVVEVRRGASSTRFGSNALGGALLLRTPRLLGRSRTRAGVGYGSFNTVAASAAHQGSGSGFRYLASASYRQSDGDFAYLDENAQPRQRQNNDSRSGELLLKADRLLAGGRWQLLALDDLSLAWRGAPGMSQRPSLSARQQDLRNLSSLRLRRFDTLLPGGRLELGLAHRYQRFVFEEPAPPPVDSRNQSFGFEAGAGLGLPLGESGRLDGGLELRAELFRDPTLSLSPWRLEADLWASSSIRLLRRHLVLVPSLRLATASSFGASVVPRFGLLLRPLRWTRPRWLRPLELAANLGRSFRYPSFQEMYIRVDGFGGNPELRPEDAVEGELGLRWRRRVLSLELAYFQRRLKNLILFAPVSSFLVRADNYRAARAEGLEAAAQARLPAGLSLRGSYTLSRTRFGSPPMQLPGHPEHRFKARLEWEAPWAARQAPPRRLDLRLWSAVIVESASVLGRFESQPEEGRVLLSAGAAVGYRGLVLSVEGENLLDKRDALDVVGFPLPPARFLVCLAAKL